MNRNEISIVIADDHPVTLKGIQTELVAQGYSVIGTASDGLEALSLIIEKQPAIALLDIDMPHLTGFDVLQTIKVKGYPTRGILLSFHKETEYILQAEKLNIQGYLLKEDSIDIINNCIACMLNGERYFSPSFQSVTLDRANSTLIRLNQLTPSEKIILKHISLQHSTTEIAEALFISTRTVEKHRSNIIQKLEIDTQTNALLQWALLNKTIISHL